METSPEHRQPTRDRRNPSGNGAVPPERRLGPGGGYAERATEQARGLVDDLTAWMELRIELARLEIEERIEERANSLARKVILGVLAGLAGLFALLTLAFALGAWLGHPAWGFLVVTGLLVLTLVAVRAAHPHLIDLQGRPREQQKHGSGDPSSAR